MNFVLRIALLASLASVSAWPAMAGSSAERARTAMQAGEILPLSRILQEVHREFVGDVIGIELDREDGRWIYEIKLLSSKGSVIKLEYDARDAKLLKAKGSDVAAARRNR